jgi:hypothetical protein
MNVCEPNSACMYVLDGRLVCVMLVCGFCVLLVKEFVCDLIKRKKCLIK